MSIPINKTGMTPQPSGLAILRLPFDKKHISKLPKPTKQQTDEVKADYKKGIRCSLCDGWHHRDVVHLDYVGHAALTDRLLECDPLWSWEPLSMKDGIPQYDVNGGLWIKLTVLGMTRLGYGHSDGKTGGNAIKESIGDALRNAAMRFGAALDLWHKGDLHLDEKTDEPSIAEKNVEAINQVRKETGFDSNSQPPKSVVPEVLQDEPGIGGYVIQFGKHKGKSLEQMDFHELCGYIDWIPTGLKGKDGNAPGGKLKENMEAAYDIGKAYIAQFTQKDPTFDSSERMDF